MNDEGGPMREPSLEYTVRALKSELGKVENDLQNQSLEISGLKRKMENNPAVEPKLGFFDFLKWLFLSLFGFLKVAGPVMFAAFVVWRAILGLSSCNSAIIAECTAQCTRACEGAGMDYVSFRTSGAAGDLTADFCTCATNGTIAVYNMTTGQPAVSSAPVSSITATDTKVQ